MADTREEYFASLLDARPATLLERARTPGSQLPGRTWWTLEDGKVVDGQALIEMGVRRLGGGTTTDKWDRVVRFRAAVEGRSASEVAKDPAFLDDWRAIVEAPLFPPGERNLAIGRAWDEMGVLEQQMDGSWRYSDEYVSWLLTQYLGRS